MYGSRSFILMCLWVGIRLQLLEWSPCAAVIPLSGFRWFGPLWEFTESAEEDRVIPSVVSDAVIPRLCAAVKLVWNPCSATQTRALHGSIQELLQVEPNGDAIQVRQHVCVRSIGTCALLLSQSMVLSVTTKLREAVDSACIPLFVRVDGPQPVLSQLFIRRFLRGCKVGDSPFVVRATRMSQSAPPPAPSLDVLLGWLLVGCYLDRGWGEPTVCIKALGRAAMSCENRACAPAFGHMLLHADCGGFPVCTALPFMPRVRRVPLCRCARRSPLSVPISKSPWTRSPISSVNSTPICTPWRCHLPPDMSRPQRPFGRLDAMH